jgi:hypothetical protein
MSNMVKKASTFESPSWNTSLTAVHDFDQGLNISEAGAHNLAMLRGLGYRTTWSHIRMLRLWPFRCPSRASLEAT